MNIYATRKGVIDQMLDRIKWALFYFISKRIELSEKHIVVHTSNPQDFFEGDELGAYEWKYRKELNSAFDAFVAIETATGGYCVICFTGIPRGVPKEWYQQEGGEDG